MTDQTQQPPEPNAQTAPAPHMAPLKAPLLSRRTVMTGIVGLGAVSAVSWVALRPRISGAADSNAKSFPFKLTDAEWRSRLTDAQFYILREHGTERPGTSDLLQEKRAGTYHCAGCDHPLFDASTKYESYTGWPSYFDTLEGAFGTTTDYLIGYPRTEYHCANCGGHHGHVFNDGPQPTGLRYCNNGLVLTFKPAEDTAKSEDNA